MNEVRGQLPGRYVSLTHFYQSLSERILMTGAIIPHTHRNLTVIAYQDLRITHMTIKCDPWCE